MSTLLPFDDTAHASTEVGALKLPVASDSRSGAATDPELESPPVEVPGYTIDRFLGRGAYGTVFLAQQDNTGKQVAIKFYRHAEGLDIPQLKREVRILASLYTSREIVQLLEVGWEAEPPYFVMEYLEHGSLEERLRRGPLPVGEAMRIFTAVTRALAQAHGAGVLHCDLKPANLLLDGQLRPRLADFGQSRLCTDKLPSLGTFFYMAPEQARLDALPDARWDVYALGAILFAMLTGEPPHKTPALRKTLQSVRGLEARLAAYRDSLRDAPRPEPALRRLGIDAGLRELTARCLAFEPDARYQSAQEVLAELGAMSRRRARRPLIILGAVGPALLLLLMTLVGWQAARAALDSSTATLQQRALESCRFAARFVAETASREIDRRFTALEEVADDEVLRATLRELTAQLPAAPIEPARRVALQAGLQQLTEETSRRHAELAAMSWFLNDKSGLQWARTPRSGTIGQNWAFRDYFHGLGHDLPLHRSLAGVKPIDAPHRSVVFHTRASGALIVAFSVPVWSEPRKQRGAREVLGVLGMTVEVGRFGELQPAAERPGAHQMALLVDSRADWTGHKGLVLQHPALSAALVRHEEVPIYRLPPGSLSAPGTSRGGPALSLDAQYVDPVAGPSKGRFLAAAEPVLSRGQDTGWVVIVEESYSDVISPVEGLGRRLIRIGSVGLFAVAVVLALLWRLVVRGPTDLGRSLRL
jgi:tRNA A-37 threonylcarbamoyl transferase component Bud32